METAILLAQVAGQIFVNFSPVIPMFALWVYLTK